ncbi:MAG: hypothetical protein KC420_11820 [Myxococcales bacterium]|nr:hypothetical protein [Myxococcales bacterium]
MVRGRPRAEDHLDEIAMGCARGRTLTGIARDLGLSYRQVWLRGSTLRLKIADMTRDTAWLDHEARTWVEVGRFWCARQGIELPEP